MSESYMAAVFAEAGGRDRAPLDGPFMPHSLGTMISMPWAWPLHVGTTATTWPTRVVSTWAAAAGQGTGRRTAEEAEYGTGRAVVRRADLASAIFGHDNIATADHRRHCAMG
jgi:hypothetical protein